MWRRLLLFALVAGFAARAGAQPGPPVPDSPTSADPIVPSPTLPPPPPMPTLPPTQPTEGPGSEDALQPVELDVGHCEPAVPDVTDQNIPTTWRDYEIE